MGWLSRVRRLEARTLAARLNHSLRRRAVEIELPVRVDQGTAGLLEARQGFTPVEQTGKVKGME